MIKVITDQNVYRQWVPPDASLYLQPAWMDIFNTQWEAQVAVDGQGQPVWMWPYQERSRYFMKKFGRLAYSPDNGPIFLKETAMGFDPEVDSWLFMIEVDDRTCRLNRHTMVQHGWQREQRFYQYFDLPGYPVDFQAVARSKRKRMKKNSTLQCYMLEELSEAADLLLNHFNTHRNTGLSYAGLKRIKDQVEQSFDSHLFGIRNPGGDLLAVQWLVGYRETIYGWVVERDPDCVDAHARELLLWHIIQWARERYLKYDLGGSSIPGVRKFNLEMGAREVQYSRYLRYRPSFVGKIRRWM